MEAMMKEVPARDGLARIKEACDYLALSRAAVYGLMDKGQLEYVKLGRSRRIPWPALRSLIATSVIGGRR